MEKWVVTAKRADFQEIGKTFGIDPVIARLIRNRDVEGLENIRTYLHGTIEELPSPWRLKDMEKAADILTEKIRGKKKIRIIGDYDIDGVTSTYILIKSLRCLGAEADTYIPDRITDGYGMHKQLILQAEADGIDTIVTCDNGIAASGEIALAKAKGMTVIVTDHHEIPYEDKEGKRIFKIPPADAVINPKQPDCPYPSKNICGAVVAWKLVWALYEKFGLSKSSALEFLEFAAIATVGDVMDLQGENRIIVKEGLRHLPNTSNPGLRALIRANGLEGGRISAYHIGFVLGPCINASGRLDTASRSLALFLAGDADTAARLAGDLTALNQSRKALTEQGKEKAVTLVETTDMGNDRVLVVYLPECHESLAGIIAGRLREKYNKPAFVLTKGEEGVKGSGRSIEAYFMYEELVKCADLLEKFGGHPMAAGLSLKEENIEHFRRRLNENCTLTEDDLTPKVVIDVPMPLAYADRNLVEQISLLEPFGKGNTKPLFAEKGLRVLGLRIFGKNHNVAKMQLLDARGNVTDAVYFGEAEEFKAFADGKESISVTYYPEINSYQGRETLQAVIRNYC
ncbi:MAG: single-stranded-DNA-specific exonuclease RecJ [Eubacteriales bacterium]|nr:single-stranded-DNA-specific exonuclease RecJ [Eubacteriales bacterium]